MSTMRIVGETCSIVGRHIDRGLYRPDCRGGYDRRRGFSLM